LREATEAMKAVMEASKPARANLGTTAKRIASTVGEGAGLVAVGLADGEKAFSRRTGVPEWALRTLLIGAVLAFGSALVAGSDYIKAFMGSQASKAVAGVLRDEEIRRNASLTASELMERLLADDRVKSDAAAFLTGLAEGEATRKALLDMLIWSLRDPATLRELAVLLTHPETMAAARDLLIWLAADPTTRRATEQLITWLVSDEEFKAQISRAGADIIHRTLDDDKVRTHASEALAEVFGDDGLQKQTGDALWNAVTWSVTPSILRSKAADTVAAPSGEQAAAAAAASAASKEAAAALDPPAAAAVAAAAADSVSLAPDGVRTPEAAAVAPLRAALPAGTAPKAPATAAAPSGPAAAAAAASPRAPRPRPAGDGSGAARPVTQALPNPAGPGSGAADAAARSPKARRGHTNGRPSAAPAQKGARHPGQVEHMAAQGLKSVPAGEAPPATDLEEAELLASGRTGSSDEDDQFHFDSKHLKRERQAFKLHDSPAELSRAATLLGGSGSDRA